MVRLRLRRSVKNNSYRYHIVAVNAETTQDEYDAEIIGNCDFYTKPTTIEVHEERVLELIELGAEPTEAVNILLRRIGLIN